jgi:hypothetical protein
MSSLRRNGLSSLEPPAARPATRSDQLDRDDAAARDLVLVAGHAASGPFDWD